MTKIMVVEDDNNLREIYGVRLNAEGYDVVTANDGEDALGKVLAEKPDLVLSDVMMPRISGFDMLDILRSTPETAKLKIVMLTALNDESQRQRGEKLGADRYLVKSQTGIDDIVATVKELLAAPATPNPTEPQVAVAQPQAQIEVATPAASVAPAVSQQDFVYGQPTTPTEQINQNAAQ
ncbi:MAG: response regulator [Candidatus Nomurabacteria bacterium]|jgi:DNA-binding response OmpR family regulator|nr:response regulator [Candidatus Nomurabacteria bacterium]